LIRRRAVVIGRHRKLGRCSFRSTTEGHCEAGASKRNLCSKHYQRWYRRRGHLRCDWYGCSSFRDDGGRSMGTAGRKVFYCRLHEHEHLRPNAQIEELNISRVGGSISPYGDCWLWVGLVQGKYGAFVPEGAGNVQWLAHRVVWDLLMRGHKPGFELDHVVCNRPPCVNPSHLEPVRRHENERRKRKSRPGPLNKQALGSVEVRMFADRFDLPLAAN
jgi:hypothetical protein